MTPPKPLTKAEAWREIAQRFANGTAERGAGLCWALVELRHEMKITFEKQQEMKARINTHASQNWIWEYEEDDSGSSGPWAFPSDDSEVRVLAALFLALEAEDEEAALNDPCEACGEIHGDA